MVGSQRRPQHTKPFPKRFHMLLPIIPQIIVSSLAPHPLCIRLARNAVYPNTQCPPAAAAILLATSWPPPRVGLMLRPTASRTSCPRVQKLREPFLCSLVYGKLSSVVLACESV